MNYGSEMGLGALIYISNFITISSGIQKLIRGDTHTHTHIPTQEGDLTSLL
jgi:hypothetical protein